MKIRVCALMALVLLLSLTACSSDDSAAPSGATRQAEKTAVEELTEEPETEPETAAPVTAPETTPKPEPEPEPEPAAPVQQEPESAAPVQQETPAASTPTTVNVIGNKNSMVYHELSCGSVSKMSEKNKVPMESAAVAEANGYKPCQNCH